MFDWCWLNSKLLNTLLQWNQFKYSHWACLSSWTGKYWIYLLAICLFVDDQIDTIKWATSKQQAISRMEDVLGNECFLWMRYACSSMLAPSCPAATIISSKQQNIGPILFVGWMSIDLTLTCAVLHVHTYLPLCEPSICVDHHQQPASTLSTWKVHIHHH